MLDPDAQNFNFNLTNSNLRISHIPIALLVESTRISRYGQEIEVVGMQHLRVKKIFSSFFLFHHKDFMNYMKITCDLYVK